ncbi:MAG: ABC transporter substrate-binding protein [Alphaproteobacteria bacterium]|nr:ABC transporter substrate-binding protein [Alphaproteobacteria bacterium]MBU0799155.1 ABC transporter substrate-binding protein [Alphaproteobacteria bacterium]MBU0888816.1 ABC transporter substrate-binding protein [Alphaproteobacteria bacterium]MBU1813836.1 ABC transporter substrate-binding protein [Alphaproteobacteria bacterium]
MYALSGVFTAAALFSAPVSAADLRVALSTEPTSIDPHYHNLSPNNALATHIFGSLIEQGPTQELQPGLALSWKPIKDDTWEFKLRQGVKFQDGSPFTADDVVFTINRAGNVPDSPSSFGIYTKPVKEMKVIDDHTVHFITDGPYPLLPNDLSGIRIISRKNAEGATTADFNSGKAAVGAGPYKLVSFTPGQSIILEANPTYWGEKPQFDKVIFRPVTNPAARVAALLSGDVDLVDGVPTADIAQLKKNPAVSLDDAVSNRIIYLHIDSDRDVTPHVTAKDGKEIKNPFKDVRVRKAISMAINRQAIVDRVMEGLAIPAGQLLPKGFFGVSPNIQVPKYDPEAAKKLLAEAGYKDGFKLTIHGPNDRYINDAQIVQAIAQMLSRIGIDTAVDTMPRSTFFGRASKLEFSLMLVGWGSGTGEASSPLKSLLATYDKAAGMGPSNRGRYSNKEFDETLAKALVTVDDAAREKLLQKATEIAMADVGLIPLHYEVSTWATRKGFKYEGRSDQGTQAMGVSIVK